MSVLINDIQEPAATEQRPIPELKEAMRHGAMPLGSTVPSIYLCGSCQMRQISADDGGVCMPCRAMLTAREFFTDSRRVEWLWAVIVAAGLIALLIWIFSIFK